jgi:putative membrane protein
MNLLYILIGIIIGTFAAIFPGIHPNSVSSIISLIPIENHVEILIAMLGVYSVIVFIPSIFFGIVDGETAIGMLPGQRLYLEGRGKEAVYIVIVSSLIAGIVAAAGGYAIFFVFDFLNKNIEKYIGYILIFISMFFIIKEKDKAILALALYLICGIFGYFTLNSKIADPLFAMFVGFFTVPAILQLKNNIPPKQNMALENKQLDFLIYILAGCLLGAIADFLPGISSPAQLAVISSIFLNLKNPRDFLSHIVAIEVSHNIFAIATSAAGNIARVGTIAIAKNFVEFTIYNYSYYAIIFLIALVIGVVLFAKLSEKIVELIGKIDLQTIGKIVLIYLTCMNLLINGLFGLVILVIASLIGFLPYKTNLPRTYLMSSIILPSIIYFFR